MGVRALRTRSRPIATLLVLFGSVAVVVAARPTPAAAADIGPIAYVAGADNVTPFDVATDAPGTAIPNGGAGIAIDGTTAYVTTGPNTVTPINTATNTAGTPIHIAHPYGIAVTPGGSTVYVTDVVDGTVVPVATATNTPGTAIAVGEEPTAIAITPNGATAYVVNSGDGTVTPITIATDTAGTPIAVGQQPTGIAITPDGATAYVVNDIDGTVTPITTATNTAGTAITVGDSPQRIAISADGSTAYVTNSGDDTVTPIATATNTAGTAIAVGDFPVGIAISGATAYVCDEFSDTVTPIAIGTNAPGTAIAVGSDPTAIAVTPGMVAQNAATVTATAGTPQSAAVNAPFATDLAVEVTDEYGNPVVGATVTFLAGSSAGGASAGFTGTNEATSGAGGIATSTTVIADGTGGSYTVTANVPGATSAHFSLTNIPAPVIGGFSPTNGNIGSTVTITGAGLAGATAVSFNGTAASVTSDTADEIVVTVPAGATSGPIFVTTSGGTTASSQSFVVDVPLISGFSPVSGAPGTPVTISGSGLAGATLVTFDNTPATVTSDTAGAIVAVVPSEATTGPIYVTTPDGFVSSSQSFTVAPPPVISNFSPQSGPAGTTVTITGSALTGASVAFNGAPATITSDNGVEIVVSVPLDASTGPISVTTAGGTTTTSKNFSLPAPVISSFSPKTGGVGSTVTIKGANLYPAVRMTVGGTLTSYSSDTPTQLVLTVPAGASSGAISVTTADGTGTSAGAFKVSLLPSITSFTPSSGVVGTSVTIVGTSLENATGVYFHGGVTGPILSDTATELTTVVPAGAENGPITVTNARFPAGGISTEQFDVTPAPVITALEPAQGGVGESVGIVGTNLLGATGVSFNGTTGTITNVTATEVTATVPNGATTGPITLTTPAGSATSAQEFTIYPTPAVRTVSPLSGPIGTKVRVDGQNLAGATEVTFGGVPATIVSDSATRVVVTASGSGPVTVTTPGGAATGSQGFTVSAPTITGFSPDAGPVGSTVTITGTNLAGARLVAFNGVPAEIISDKATRIDVDVPALATSGPITVTTPGGSATSTQSFLVASSGDLRRFVPRE